MFFYTLSCLALAFLAQAEQSVWFTNEVSEGIEARANPLLTRLDEEYAEAQKWLGLPARSTKGRVRWVKNKKELQLATKHKAPKWSQAVTFPSSGQMVIALQEIHSQEKAIKVIQHEMVHYTMGVLPASVQKNFPAWFHEGIAEFFAKDVLLDRLGVELSWLAFFGDLSFLSQYEKGFGQEALGAAEGYALGYHMVARWVRLYGEDFPARLIKLVAVGKGFEQSVIELTGFSTVTHEQDLRKELASWHALLNDGRPRLFLWMSLALLASFPFVRKARRRRREKMEAKWRAEEEREWENEQLDAEAD